jgi:hypothetical protein
MFGKIKSNISLIGVFILLLVVAFLGLTIFVNNAKMSILESKLETSEQAKLVLQTNVTQMSSNLAQAELDKTQLRLDAKHLAQLLSDRERQRGEKSAELIANKQQIQHVIYGAKDEATIRWADTGIPADINRVLELAANCTNRHSNENSLCVAAKGTHRPVPGV